MNEPRICVIGAGCSGITAVKNLVEAGFEHVVCFEKSNDIGGNWRYSPKESHSSVCETTHIISSKSMSEYLDFPMPDDYPDYPSHEQVLAYFEAYAEHFGVKKYIRFNTVVASVEKIEGEKWRVTLASGESETFEYLLVANGHHSVPRWPDLPGKFTGESLHSHSYKTNQPFDGKRVLIIGAGNSGCDCAVEISRVATSTAISMRRPYYIIPKFLMGKPTDTFNGLMLKLPKFIRKVLINISLRLQVGDFKDYGLERPDYPITNCHPVLNSELLYKIRHGKVRPRRGIQLIDGRTVVFEDGKKEDFDVIVAATGYKISFPFFDKNFLDWEDAERIPLYLRMIHPQHPTLFFIGLLQPQGCVWPLSDIQSKLVANIIAGKTRLPSNLEQLAEAEAEAAEIAREFLAAKRHSVEVHFGPFFKKIQRHIPA
ncbi:MAG: NAD(P)-binding domain-containing protein [Saprospiraceae bacterium]|nr:NAD(P)-binding domain-containing protein [Saprospiraceae bacterium]MCF8250900.1 NAD(P)-binding domain-containing protein [Saprospiraceae bacterium]MCF8282713.1 NAD(P)-binding domain-containing protein [Bacteroidales bacterium]MCF8311865.1 NAD(P)-binding domain-containing protein [Saprospiraceae bacterium]MCF8443021.1 NAD(P)-binding domain-containing protein [Saprospiraceae bacterium]